MRWCELDGTVDRPGGIVLAAAGSAVLVMSTDLEEIMEVSDRVVVLADGNLRHDAYLSETSRDEILQRLSEVE